MPGIRILLRSRVLGRPIIRISISRIPIRRSERSAVLGRSLLIRVLAVLWRIRIVVHQYFSCELVRGKGSVSRMFAMPVMYMRRRSKPMPKPE